MTLRTLACALTFTTFSVCAQTSAEPATPLQTNLDKVLDQAIAQQKIVGAVILVSQNGQIIYHRAAGYAHRETQKPMREDNIFRLASMSKPIVSVAALALVDQGKLNLDDPITRWLPDFQPRLNKNAPPPVITVRQLLTHTAGLDYGFFEKPDGPYHRLGVSDGIDHPKLTLQQNLHRLSTAPLLFEPGTQWHYSLATDVLGAVIAKAGGSSLQEVVRNTVTQPLGMKDTAFRVTDINRLTIPYADGTPQPIKMPDPYSLPFGESAIIYSPSRILDANAYPSGGAGMAATAHDYMRLLEALRTDGHGVLKPDTVKQFSSNATGNLRIDTMNEGWGFGLGVGVLKDPTAAKTLMHTGSWSWGGVYGNTFWVDPEASLSVIVLTNTAVTGMAGDFPDALVNAVYTSLNPSMTKGNAQ